MIDSVRAILNKEYIELFKKKDDVSLFFHFCEDQSILGIAFDYIQFHFEEFKSFIRKEILWEWIGISEQIKTQNRLVNEKAVELSCLLRKERICNCILKGQGNAVMYPNPLLRMSGDIDIWVDGNEKEIIRSIRRQFPDVHYQYHHIEFPIYNDIIVELHYKPSFLYNFVYNHRLQVFYQTERKEQFANTIELPDNVGMISCPTYRFNCVFQMSHLMHHFFDGGVGLRQLIDYYYLLKSKDVTGDINWDLLFDKLGMHKFAKGVMWVEKEYLGLDKQYLLIEEDRIIGSKILKDILKTGNMGNFYLRNNYRSNILFIIAKLKRNMIMLKDFPSEILCQPFFLLWHQWWKYKMKIITR